MSVPGVGNLFIYTQFNSIVESLAAYGAAGTSRFGLAIGIRTGGWEPDTRSMCRPVPANRFLHRCACVWTAGREAGAQPGPVFPDR